MAKKQSKKQNKKLNKKLSSLLLAAVLLVALSLFSVLTESEEGLPSEPVSTQTTQAATTQATTAEGQALTVHFIDVGQADCALLECGGEYMLIDAGNVADGELIVSYLQQQGVEELHTVICTHAHEDHSGGMAAVLAVFPTKHVYSPVKTYSSRCFENFLYYVDQQGLTITDPVPGSSFQLGGATVTILGPVKTYPEPNDTSIVCRVQFGNNSFLFTGDMEKLAETDLLDSGAYVKADVLKMGHHGSDTSTGYYFLRQVDPTYTVISVGTDNDYGHPHEEPMSRLRHQETVIFRTDEMGTIVARADGNEITFFWEKQSANPEHAQYTGIYVGNKNSLTVHDETCGSLPSAKNRVEFDTLDEALEAGYKLCSGCIG